MSRYEQLTRKIDFLTLAARSCFVGGKTNMEQMWMGHAKALMKVRDEMSLTEGMKVVGE